MIGTALKSLAAQFHMAVNNGMAYGYMQGSFVTLTEGLLHRRLSIYVGSVNVPLSEGEERSPAAQCSELIAEMISKASGDENIYGIMSSSQSLIHGGSVVSLTFRKDEAGLNGMQRFIAELLPQITPLTAPLQCSHCGGHTNGQGYPVQISPDTAVPMHAQCLQECVKDYSTKHKTIPGIIGACVGALLGAAVWAMLFPQGILSALGTLLILLLVLGGYKLLRGEAGKTQCLVIAACMVVAILLGTTAQHLWALHQDYLAYGSVVNSMMRESVYLRVSLKEAFTSGDALPQLLINLICGLVFAALAAVTGLHKNPSSKPQAMPGQA